MPVRDADYRWERRIVRAGLGPVAGADEAGRGACAGPLVAGAVALDPRPSRAIRGLRDSKLLSAASRERLYGEITQSALSWSAVVIEPPEIDALGLHEANLQALRRALRRLDPPVGYALTDGFPVDGIGCPGLAIWKGDAVASCVAAASIVAKVTRDRIMQAADELFPGYGFAVHKGYATSAHQRALDDLGPCSIHRRSYANVAAAARRHEASLPAGSLG